MSSTQPSEQPTSDASEEEFKETIRRSSDEVVEAIRTAAWNNIADGGLAVRRGGLQYKEITNLNAPGLAAEPTLEEAEDAVRAFQEGHIEALTALRLQEYSNEYDAMTKARHEMGAEKYGPVRFAEVDSLQMAMEEVADLGNYARYTFIKLRMLQDAIEKERDGWKAQGVVPAEGKFISFKKS